MTSENTYDSSNGSNRSGRSRTAVKDKTSGVAQDAGGAAERVTGAAKHGASDVVDEAKGQARNLLSEASGQVRDQAAVQQRKVAEGLRSVSGELHTMANNSEQKGMASEIVQQVAGRADSVAHWLDARDPGSLLEEVKDFARRRPGVFIAIAAGAGILAGRLVKAATTSNDESARSRQWMDTGVSTREAPLGSQYAGTMPPPATTPPSTMPPSTTPGTASGPMSGGGDLGI